MNKVEEIEHAVAALPDDDYRAFREWFTRTCRLKPAPSQTDVFLRPLGKVSRDAASAFEARPRLRQ